MWVCQPNSQLHPQGVDTLNSFVIDEFMGVVVSAELGARELSGEYHVIYFNV